MASSSVNFCQKTRNAQQQQPDGANPNTAESMVKAVRRTGQEDKDVTLWFVQVNVHCYVNCFTHVTRSNDLQFIQRSVAEFMVSNADAEGLLYSRSPQQ